MNFYVLDFEPRTVQPVASRNTVYVMKAPKKVISKAK
jgi:hypothetical protein